MHKKIKELFESYESVLAKENKKSSFYNGIYDRWENPVLTRDHIPVFWKYDLNTETNPNAMERLGVNAVFNSGALYKAGKYYLVARVEGNDRKSFFAVAESTRPTEGFRFWDFPVELPDTEEQEVNVYDMRLTAHEDGYIYGVFCSESKDTSSNDLSAANAAAGIVRTKDLKSWERLPNLKTKSPQQRNVVLHPEFVDGKYAFFTRPQDDFIDTGSGGGVGFALCENICKPEISDEKIVSYRKYHTITEVKNGAGAVPIKTERGWIHIAHGVRNTAAGLRYVIYVFATDLNDPAKLIAEPSGFFVAPLGKERVGDVSNVVFTNGAVVNEKGEVFIYYASDDTRLHVASTTVEKLIDYTFNTPEDPLRSPDCVRQRCEFINKNLAVMQQENAERALVYSRYNDWLANADRDPELSCLLRSLRGNEEEITECFYRELSFGTGGLRGAMGPGTNRINVYTVGQVTQGLADYLKEEKADPSVCIAYDTRNMSQTFAETAAAILSANGIRVNLFESTRPTPMLSFATRHLKADCGIVITASHNPKEDNGYKVYGSDGGQLTEYAANKVLKQISQCNIFEDIKFSCLEDALAGGKLKIIGSEVDEKYYSKVVSLINSAEKDNGKFSESDLKIIYTPLHGSGNKPVREMLSRLGFSDVAIVPEQEIPNGDFPTVAKPNPEEPSVFELAVKMAQNIEPDLIFGTDPDCDRIGVMTRDENGGYVVLTGNQTGALLCDYIIKTRKMPENPAVINTIVTSDLANRICENNSVACFDVLTGFKYIGELIGEWESKKEKTHNFIFGFEESYGYLSGDFVRDKDAVIAASLVAKMALYYKNRGMTLYRALNRIFEENVYTKEKMIPEIKKGKNGQMEIAKIMKNMREGYKEFFKNELLEIIEDYGVSKRFFTGSTNEEALTLPKSNVLKFIFKDKSWLALRPSGTEPKIKIYLYSQAKDEQTAQNRIDELEQLAKRILK